MTALVFSFSFSQGIVPRPQINSSAHAGRLAGSHPTCQARQARQAVQSRLNSIPSLLGSSCGKRGRPPTRTDDYEAPPSSLFFPLTHRQTRPADYLTRALHPTPAVFMRLAQCLGRYRHPVAVPSEPLFWLPTSHRACFLFTSLPSSQSPPTVWPVLDPGCSPVPRALAICCTQ